jgi:hypothetical protein
MSRRGKLLVASVCLIALIGLLAPEVALAAGNNVGRTSRGC